MRTEQYRSLKDAVLILHGAITNGRPYCQLLPMVDDILRIFMFDEMEADNVSLRSKPPVKDVTELLP